MKLRPLLCCLGAAVLAALAPACVDDPGVDDPALDDLGAMPDASSPVGEPIGTSGLVPGICLPRTCGILGTPEACGMQDDGCGGIQWCGPCACGTAFTACEIDTPVIAEAVVALGPSQTLVASTSGLSSGADSVLHLLTIGGSQIMVNDDISATNRASRITYTAPALVGATVIIVARAKSASTAGTATLSYQSTSVTVPLAFPVHDVASSRAGDRLQTVGLPALASSAHVVYRMSGANIASRTAGSTGVSVDLPSSGTTRYLIGRTGTSGAATPARLLRNDENIAGHDPDQDDLGSNLEAALGTCSSLSGTAYDRFGVGFACSLAADPRDTDGDGLRDDWEVRGRLDVSPQLALARWGADPRHKDLFVEVDYGRATASEAEVAVTAAEVTRWAAFWADRIGTVTAAQRAAHVASLRNPDGKPGVRLHVDSGVAPTAASAAALYGDWGGHGIVPPDPAGGRLHYATARQQHMNAGRKGVFRYALRAADGAGQGGGLAFVYGGDGRTAAHETGHTVGLMHDGRYNPMVSINCKPNYASVMNYGYNSVEAGFSDDTGAPDLNNARLVEWRAADPSQHAKFMSVMQSEFGYTVGSNGDIDWNRDGVIAPAGQTVEAYVNYRGGSSCEYTRAGATDVAGPHASATAPALARLSGRTFIFSGLAGQLGWTYTTSPLACRVPDGQGACADFTTSGQIAGLASDYGVDAVRLTDANEVLVVGLSSSYTLRWTRITGFSGTAPVVGPIRTLASGGAPVDQPTLAINESGTPELHYRDATGALRFRRYVRSADAWGAEQAVLDSAGQPVHMWLLGSPGAALAPPLDGSTTTPAMHLVFAAGEAGCMQMWHRDPGTARWLRDDRLPTCADLTDRPAIQWVPDPTQAILGGRLHIVYRSKTPEPEKSRVRMMTSRSEGTTGPRMSPEGLYDNTWTYGVGADLLYEPGIDTNLRAAWTRTNYGNPDPGDPDKRMRVRFDPKADGLTDYTYGGEDDWRLMRSGICEPLANEQPAPVTCPAPPLQARSLPTMSQ